MLAAKLFMIRQVTSCLYFFMYKLMIRIDANDTIFFFDDLINTYEATRPG